jgi:uncharacterized membrane protein YdbT with pleckstrin-like domain
MEKREKYFDSQEDDEEIIYLIRRHWFTLVPALVGSFCILLLGFLGLAVLPFVAPKLTHGFAFNIYTVTVSLIFLFGIGCAFANLVLYYLNTALVTSQHVVDITQTGFFVRDISELQLIKIQDVAAKQNGLFESLFNFGTVEIETAGDLPNFIFEKIPEPGEYAQRIMKLQEKYRDDKGISKKEAEELADQPIQKDKKDDKIESVKAKA